MKAITVNIFLIENNEEILISRVSVNALNNQDAIKKVKRGINNDDVKSGGSGGGEQQM